MKNIIQKRNIPSDILIFAVAKIKSAPDVAERWGNKNKQMKVIENILTPDGEKLKYFHIFSPSTWTS